MTAIEKPLGMNDLSSASASKMSAFKKIFRETADPFVSFYNIQQNITKTDRQESRAL